MYTALSFAYNSASHVVQTAETLLDVKGMWKTVTIRRAIKTLEQPILIKEINPAAFIVQIPSGAPKAPQYTPSYLCTVCERLIQDIRNSLQSIKEGPGKVQARLNKAETDLSSIDQARQALEQKGITFSPYKDRRGSIDVVRGQVSTTINSDPFGALTRCTELDRQVKGLSDELAQANTVYTRLQAAAQSQIACGAQNEALSKQQIAYSPYHGRVDAIETVRKQVEDAVGMDPAKALRSCDELDKQIRALAKELQDAASLVAQLSAADLDLNTKQERVARIRETNISCPWSEPRDGDATTWTLSAPDTNPDQFFDQSTSLLSQARNSLSSGNFPVIAGEIKQAETVRNQAMNMVQAQFDAKASVDEKVPRVRAELSKLHAEVAATTGGSTNGEMSQLVKRACDAIEDRLREIRDFYGKQKFSEAVSLLTGNAGSEHGMPISKLMEQAQELCKLLKQAAEVANKVQAQLAQ
jgi:hypothetical protein